MNAAGKAERRQLTVLFCEAVGSTQIAAELGPEAWRNLLREYQKSVAEVVERFDGSVAQFLGDGVMAYFGYPRAHEDDAERAIRAGLAIAEVVGDRSPELVEAHGRTLRFRIGIHTGQVVIGELGAGGHQETVAVGETTNIAARVQAEAGPGEVLISEGTLRLVRGVFVTQALGARELRGVSTPLGLYIASAPSSARTRLGSDAPSELAPFVARSQELELLEESWSQARGGRGQIALLGGEAGMGKSRLVRVFRSRLADDSHRWVECRGSKFHTHTAFHPLVAPLAETLNVDVEQTPELQRSQLERGLSALGLDPESTGPLLGSLLGLPLSEHDAQFAASPEARRRMTLEALITWTLALAKSRPVVFVVEDLHWMDSATLDLLASLIARVSDAPLLLMPTYRLSFQPPWGFGSNARRVTLNPLTRVQTEEMVLGVTRGSSLPDSVRAQVIAKTDGVPLFVEEFTQAVLESGVLEKHEDHYEETGPIPVFSVPTTLRDSLMARLDRLGDAKGLAQTAAVLGREFSPEVLAALMPDAPTLQRDLDALVGAGVLQRSMRSGRASYSFKHALIQDTAYDSLLSAEQRKWHARVAQTLEERFPASAAGEPERLALHCEQGGLIEQAVDYYRKAAEQAAQRAASAQRIRHLTHGIELLGTLPENAARDERELALQLELGRTLVTTKGWASPGAATTFGRARTLCKRIGEPPEVFQVMRGLITFYVGRAELEISRELIARLMEIAEQSGESAQRLLAHEHLGILHYFEGNPSEALAQYEKAVALYEPSEHAQLAHVHGEDLGVFSHIWMAWALWILGRPDEALRRCHEGIDIGEKSSHPFSHAYALLWTAILHTMRREPVEAAEMADRALAIAMPHGFVMVLAMGYLAKTWAFLQAPLEEKALETTAEGFRQCAAQMEMTGNKVNDPMMFAYLAEAYLRAKQYDKAMSSVEEGLARSNATQWAWWDAELLRVKGEIVLQSGGEEDEAERLITSALETARTQKAKSFELRAALSLGRLWQQRGESERARGLVSPIYDSFSEGLACADLVEASRLVGGL